MKISLAQFKALYSAEKFGNPMYHLRGQSQHGGFMKSTLPFLRRRGWIKGWKITAEGRRVLKENSS